MTAKLDKPSIMRWSDDLENEQAVSSWKDVLVEGTKRCWLWGLPLDESPMKKAADSANFISPREVALGPAY